MQARLRRAATLLIVAAIIGAAAITASAGTAERPRQTVDLRAQNETLAQRSHAAVLKLYALESRLERSRLELTRVRERIAQVGRERAELRHRLAVAERTVVVSEHLLAERLLALYQQEEADPLAIVLGAESLDDAIAGLEGLKAVASQDARIAAATRTAKRELARLSRTLAARTAVLRRLESAEAAKAGALERERAERVGYISRLAAERRLNATRIAALERAARAAVERAEQISAIPPARVFPAPYEGGGAGARPPRPVTGPRTLTVVATGYSIAGRTATGIMTGRGVVAVDPAVIPLGTRMTIPGYGEGIAADVGSAVRGARIDLWFPTQAQALAWGERTVTITLR